MPVNAILCSQFQHLNVNLEFSCKRTSTSSLVCTAQMSKKYHQMHKCMKYWQIKLN